MNRILALGLFFVMTTVAIIAPTSAAQRLQLTCVVTGMTTGEMDKFTKIVCDEAIHQLRELTGQAVELSSSPEEPVPWLKLEVAIRSPYAAIGVASWGGDGVLPGQGAEIEAGITDATLNGTVASMLVRALLSTSPYVAPESPA